MRHSEVVRHFGSLLISAVFGPAVFLLTGTGLSAFATARNKSFIEDPLSPAAALGALLLAGVLYGILVMSRLSPLGPGLTGMAFLGVSGWALVASPAYEATFGLLDVHMGGAVGQSGLGFLLGVPLIATLTSPRRWRKNPYPKPAYPAQAYPVQTYAAPPQDPYQYRPDLTLPDIAPPSLGYPAGMPVPVPQRPAGPVPPPAPAQAAPATEDATVKITPPGSQ